jgi:hypothetical protein
MQTTSIDHKELRKQLEDTYFVQWVTKFDSTQGHLQVVGNCVRNRKTWETLFYHKDYGVCQKIADILNEEELTNVRRT